MSLRVPSLHLAPFSASTHLREPNMLTHQTEFTPGISESVILSRVRAFVQQNSSYWRPDFVLAEDDRFCGTPTTANTANSDEAFEKAALDAKYVTAMINFVEEEFGVLVSSCEISEDNLGSLRAVARFVASKHPFAVG